MAGIFGGHIFEGLGQTTAAENREFSSLVSSLASRPPSATAAAIASGVTIPGGGKSAAWTPDATAPAVTFAPAPADNTMLYVVGGVAAVSVVAALLMASRRRVTPNRRRKRSRR